MVQGSGSIASLESAGVLQEPRGEWIEGNSVNLADGNVRYIGNPIAIWTWNYIRQDSRDALRVYCTGASVELYIQTIDNEEEFKIYRAIMRWPDEKIKAGWSRSIKFGFSVEFLILEEIAESV